jgi:hypothetical protein
MKHLYTQYTPIHATTTSGFGSNTSTLDVCTRVTARAVKTSNFN